jgi:hypothetical protein
MKRARTKGRKPRKMTKRYITILPDIIVKNLDGTGPYYFEESEKDKKPEDRKGLPTSHRSFLRQRSADDSFGTKGVKGLQASAAIRAAIGDREPGDVIVLDEDEWELLKLATEMPSAQRGDGTLLAVGYNSVAGPQLMPFIRAILDAKTEDPRKAEEAAPAP